MRTKVASSDRPLEDRFEGRPEFSAAGRASFLRKDASSGRSLAPKAAGILASRCMSPSDAIGRATPKRLRSDSRSTFLAVSGVRSRCSLNSALDRKTAKRLQTDSCPISARSVAHMAGRRYRRGGFETPAGHLLDVDAGYDSAYLEFGLKREIRLTPAARPLCARCALSGSFRPVPSASGRPPSVLRAFSRRPLGRPTP